MERLRPLLSPRGERSHMCFALPRPPCPCWSCLQATALAARMSCAGTETCEHVRCERDDGATEIRHPDFDWRVCFNARARGAHTCMRRAPVIRMGALLGDSEALWGGSPARQGRGCRGQAAEQGHFAALPVYRIGQAAVKYRFSQNLVLKKLSLTVARTLTKKVYRWSRGH